MMPSTEIARRQPSRVATASRNATATYTITDAQTPSRPQSSAPGRQRQYTPRAYQPPPAHAPSNPIGALEAEYLATLFFIFLTIFTDQGATYSAKMLAVMKRITFASILFFILALMSTGSENMAKFSKAVGLLVLAGVFLSTAGQGTVSVLDDFFKADWTQGSTTEGDSSGNAGAGQQTGGAVASGESALQRAEQAFLNSLNRTGNGLTGTGSSNPFIKAFEQLLGAI